MTPQETPPSTTPSTPVGQRIDDFARDYAQQSERRKRRRGKWIVFPLLLATGAADFLVPRSHLPSPPSLWDVMPTFYTLYGLVSAFLLIVFSQWLGHRLTRPETGNAAHPHDR